MTSSLLTAQSESTPSASALPSSRSATLAERFEAVRAQTEHLCEPLDTEDYVVSSMADVSPTKWHLAHTSWFFETFILASARAGVSLAESAVRLSVQFLLRPGG